MGRDNAAAICVASLADRIERGEAVTYEVLKGRRKRQTGVGLEPAGALQHRPSNLEREEGVAARHPPEVGERPRRKLRVQASDQQPVDVCRRQRSEPQTAEATLGECLLEVERHSGRSLDASRDQQPNRLVRQSAGHERESALRGMVEPLHVVDPDEDRALSGERAQDAERSDRHRPLQRLLPYGLPPQERHLERVTLWLGELAQDLVRYLGEQIAERSVGELRLRLDGSTRQHPVRAGSGSRKALLPEHRLADPDLTLQQDGGRAALDVAQEPVETAQLRCAADDHLRVAGHRAIAPEKRSQPDRSL